uniref:Uncharacterized protein n=1 Tax=Lepeophtheirus salmonis TaxID=72036 RepID=A0A0K2UDQ1_LEPSM
MKSRNLMDLYIFDIEYYLLVKDFYESCTSLERGKHIEENMNKKDLTKLLNQNIGSSSWDEILPMLKEIELIMEKFTQRLEQLPAEEVKVQQRLCEKERRLREHACRVAKQKEIEANRNRKALDRALAEPYRPHMDKLRSEKINEVALKKSKKKRKT